MIGLHGILLELWLCVYVFKYACTLVVIILLVTAAHIRTRIVILMHQRVMVVLSIIIGIA